MYVDAAYCYRPKSVVRQSVALEETILRGNGRPIVMYMDTLQWLN